MRQNTYRIILTLVALSISTFVISQNKQLVYLPLGDSYTIGEGVDKQERFPDQLVFRLLHNDVKIIAPVNPAKTGWTTQDLLDKEMPIARRMSPDVVTLLIGVNDWVQGVSKETFASNFERIIKELKSFKKPPLIIAITIPDFGVTPEGAQYGLGRNISEGIAQFNELLTNICELNEIPVVDIYETTQEMKNKPELIHTDGLHPSGKEYKLWVDLILPVFLQTIQQK